MYRGTSKTVGRILNTRIFVRFSSNLRKWGTDIAREPKPIYLDAQATTPLDPRVLDDMLPFLTNEYGNPHSRTHKFGWDAEAAVEKARAQVASLIGSNDPKEIVFTSGATESNNLALKGIANFYKEKKRHIITSVIEHKCVLDSCRVLQDQYGFEVTYLKVNKEGLVDLDELADTIRPTTSLVSIMFINNEMGSIQNIKRIGELCRSRKVFFHTDAAQGVGKIPINVNDLNIDLMSISGHKIYGPKGVGALYVRRRPRVRLDPIINGGGQERGLRSGTLPPALVVGLGSACNVAQRELPYDYENVHSLSEHFLKRIERELPHVTKNGSFDPSSCYPGCVNLSFSFVEGESLLLALNQIALSSGSACTSASLEPSYVLRALGVNEDLAHSSIRFGIGRFTSKDEIDATVDSLVENVNKLRELSPLYEMYQEGIDINSINWSQH
ncbi:putative cysteine desulfurase, mitochondrial [Zancudomyces culisetae]|uniref:Cysteine desulfurase, mitosomal n=1 Tax=Zancudomyces culisetae TaxID=1213189 RepID=A0A1R1PVT6_ZANCU|nr:putative cysteine desulfurase, mitochondrial [Zancudomyces culisetae]|eukprot:OMH85081.1 putative cysteine desulfurase, mitochondrial [Zancudomyces culisetae]